MPKTNERLSATVQTTDGTQTTVITYALPDNCVAFVMARWVGRRPSNGDSMGKTVFATYKRHSAGGAVELAAETHNTYNDVGAGAWGLGACDVAPSGNNILVRVQGAAAMTIEWLCELKVQIYEP